MGIQYERNLRGAALARHIQHLNGHQAPVRFIIFQPVWFFMILAISLAGMIPLLKYVALAGLIGLGVEVVIWLKYVVRTGRFNAYPGLGPWCNIQLRRHIMNMGRRAGRLSQPR